MKASLAKQLLRTLGLSDDVINSAITDLELMARYKYDHYEMFSPGTRFLERLFSWLRQFESDDREVAVRFVRDRLIFISQREMQDLARFLYFDLIVPEILQTIVKKENLAPFDLGRAFAVHFSSYLRCCLFVGISDGAKIDYFRRHHIDLSQEQVLPYYRTNATEYVDRLKEDTGDPTARFWAVFLIDDFSGSGYTLLHEVVDPETSRITSAGALVRIYQYQKEVIDQADVVYLCHYIATDYSRRQVERLAERFPPLRNKLRILTALRLTNGHCFTPENAAADTLASRVIDMCGDYYRDEFEDRNTKAGGGIRLGYGGQGLPLVLFSNTPNNSLFLLWLDRSRAISNRFTPLFPRINRHRPK